MNNKSGFAIYGYITNALDAGRPDGVSATRRFWCESRYNFRMKKIVFTFAPVLQAFIFIGLAYANSLFAAPTASHQILQQGTVMGFRHYEGKQIWEQLRVGQPLTLIREPENSYDAQAIRVEWRGHKLGYVPRADNSDLARLIDNGTVVEARINKLEKSRRPNNRVRFEIYLP